MDLINIESVQKKVPVLKSGLNSYHLGGIECLGLEGACNIDLNSTP